MRKFYEYDGGGMGLVKRKVHYVDFLEESLGEALTEKQIQFTHESEIKTEPVLDFHLPDHDIHIEVKQYYSDRIAKQLQSKQNVIVLQGRKAVAFFNQLIKNQK